MLKVTLTDGSVYHTMSVSIAMGNLRVVINGHAEFFGLKFIKSIEVEQ